jgi:hypothetical protein
MKNVFALGLAVSVLTACAGVQTPVVDPAVTDCRAKVLLSALENDVFLVDNVLDGQVSLSDALALVGAVDAQVTLVREQLKACAELVVAPPPAPGDKVM